VSHFSTCAYQLALFLGISEGGMPMAITWLCRRTILLALLSTSLLKSTIFLLLCIMITTSFGFMMRPFSSHHSTSSSSSSSSSSNSRVSLLMRPNKNNYGPTLSRNKQSTMLFSTAIIILYLFVKQSIRWNTRINIFVI